MLRYIAGRVLTAIPTLFIVVTLAFFMMRLAPGGPFDSERALPPAIEANMKAAYGLDQPLHVQYATPAIHAEGWNVAQFGNHRVRNFV